MIKKWARSCRLFQKHNAITRMLSQKQFKFTIRKVGLKPKFLWFWEAMKPKKINSFVWVCSGPFRIQIGHFVSLNSWCFIINHYNTIKNHRNFLYTTLHDLSHTWGNSHSFIILVKRKPKENPLWFDCPPLWLCLKIKWIQVLWSR